MSDARRMPEAPERARVLIVDDHPLVREGLASRVSAQPDLEVCGEADDIDAALQLIAATRPHLVIVDIALKSDYGLDLIQQIVASGEPSYTLVVSAYEEALFAERALSVGARGYINKQELQGKVIDAIRAVLRGELFVSAAIAQRLLGRAVAGNALRSDVESLTPRELQIFRLIGHGRSTREIAEELSLSVHTIESHRERIRAKLDLRNGIELMRRAVLWHFENG